MSARRPLVLAASLAAAACSNPSELPSADRAGVGPAATLSGQVVVETQSRGNVLVFLFDASNPPPPVGTGHPFTFLQIPAAQIFGSDLHDSVNPGPFAVDYQFPVVDPGTYLVTAQLDFDQCLLSPSATCQLADFNPFFDVTDQPNANDLIGGHVDLTQQLVPVVMPVGTTPGVGVNVDGVSVVVGGTPLPDRPAFQVMAATAAIDVTQPATGFALQVRPVNAGPVSEQQPAFLVRYRDENGDGVPDVDANGIPQLWPKIFLRKVADPDPKHPSALDPELAAGLRDENDLANTGQLDATGIAYSATTTPPAVTLNSATPSLILLEAAIANPMPPVPQAAALPVQIYAQLAEPDGGANLDAVVPMTTLPMVLFPVALDARDPTAPVPLAAVPAGRYAVIVEQFTGQTWRLPNELEPSVASELGTAGLADQGWMFTVAQ